MEKSVFIEKTFTAPQRRVILLTSEILNYVSPDADVRILDLGCGSGGQIYDLAKTLKRAHLTGVDISKASIKAAENDPRRDLFLDRVTFLAVDYLEFTAAPFDIIVSDSVLQNISVSKDRLLIKLSSEIKQGGLIFLSLPYDCLFNRALWLLRHAMSLLRGSLTDKLILSLGRIIHGDAMSDELLQERVHYMYLLPHFRDDESLRQIFDQKCDLEFLNQKPLPHSSIAQPKHRLSIYRKRSS